MNFDDNADYCPKWLFAVPGWSQKDDLEQLAAEQNINYVGLDGSLGCQVNGTSLPMSTMDMIRLHGDSSANFLDTEPSPIRCHTTPKNTLTTVEIF